jgi:hypothetical protein
MGIEVVARMEMVMTIRMQMTTRMEMATRMQMVGLPWAEQVHKVPVSAGPRALLRPPTGVHSRHIHNVMLENRFDI